MSLKLQHQDLTDSEIIIQSKGAESVNEHLFPENCRDNAVSLLNQASESKKKTIPPCGQ